jgi:hypothetical protein
MRNRKAALFVIGVALLVYGLSGRESSSGTGRFGYYSESGYPLAARVEMTLGAVLTVAGYFFRDRPSN